VADCHRTRAGFCTTCRTPFEYQGKQGRRKTCEPCKALKLQPKVKRTRRPDPDPKCCKRCDKVFQPFTKKQACCSHACGQKYRFEVNGTALQKGKLCLACGNPSGFRKYCSVSCSGKHRGELKLALRPNYDCKRCGISFKPKSKTLVTFCSRDCAFAYGKTQGRDWVPGWHERRAAESQAKAQASRTIACAVCGNAYESKTAKSKVCSRECDLYRGRERGRAYSRAKSALLPATVNRECKQCGAQFNVARTRGCGRKICAACAQKNLKAFRRDFKNHRTRARHAGVPYFPIKRSEVVELYGRKCWLCKKPIPLETETLAEMFSLDHVVPLSLGGWHHISNVRPAHHRCNSMKSNTFSGQLMLTVQQDLTTLEC
jgi:hypothetical protein